MKFQNCEVSNIVFNNLPFKHQKIMIIINKAQKDCDLPVITF